MDAPSRRSLLRAAALAATGAVAGTVALDATPAAAAATLELQNTAQLTVSPTQVTCKAANPGAATFAFASGGALIGAAASPSYPCALGGWTAEPAQPTGMYGFSAVAAGMGVVGHVNGPGASVGVRGISEGGTGVIGNSASQIGVFGGGATIGVSGEGVTGVSGSGSRYGLESARADRAALRLAPTGYGGGVRAAPRSRADVHQTGEIDVDAAGDLWYCAAGGTPGTWRKLAGGTTAGAFHPVVPGRAYDSRTPNPGPPRSISVGGSRLVSVAARRDVTTGAVVEADQVPVGATAIACNVTVVDTVDAGFLAINPGGMTEVRAATVNWSASGQILNNGVTLTLNGARELTVVAGGDPGASTHVVIDVTGYYL